MTLKELYILGKGRLKSAEIDAYEKECIYLIEKNFGMTKKDIIIDGNREIDDISSGRFLSDINIRISGTPIQYILGKWEFFGLPFYVGKGVLIPRDDTEVCVNLAIKHIKEKNLSRVVDLCSGSGAISIALKGVCKDIIIDAIESSSIAFDYLTRNIELNLMSINSIKADIFKVYDLYENESIDLIISNPPYIKSDDINNLQREVKSEPLMALDGGEDGLLFYRNIIALWTSKLKKGGILVFEIGENQLDDILDMLKNDYKNVEVMNDLGDCERAISAEKI